MERVELVERSLEIELSLCARCRSEEGARAARRGDGRYFSHGPQYPPLSHSVSHDLASGFPRGGSNFVASSASSRRRCEVQT